MIDQVAKKACGERLHNPFRKETVCGSGVFRQRENKRNKTGVTPGGQKLSENLKIAKLQQQVGQLTKIVAELAALIDPEERAAAIRVRAISPTNAQLRLWAASCEPPAESATLED